MIMINNDVDHLVKNVMSAFFHLIFIYVVLNRQLVVRQADRSYLSRALKHQLGIDLKYGLKIINIEPITAMVK